MIARIWYADIDPARGDDYEAFTANEALPMFSSQPGCLGVVFARSGHRCRVITLWSGEAMLEKFERSGLYDMTVAKLAAAGLLSGPQMTECFEVHGGEVTPQLPLAVAGA